MLQLYNTLSRRKEPFEPITPGYVGLYTCGPTIYNFIHIGNFKCYCWEDLLKRYLIFKGFKVKQVMNFTDVDDKTIKASMRENKPLREYTETFKKAFIEDAKMLDILPAEVYCPATEHIPEMVALIKKLMEKGYAYRGEDGSIYFSISKFPDYGKLAGIDVTKLKEGARVKQDEYEKEGVGDFALWKAWDENDGPVFWETELGKGRPGWHIECSAMSMKYLGEHFDMHTGGIDNKFPHHENEMAQSEAAAGKKFVNFWLHTAHLMVEGQKMSKSLGNFYTLRDLTAKGLKPAAIRYVFLNSQYRQPLNFTIESVNDAQKALDSLQNFIARLRDIKEKRQDEVAKALVSEAIRGFEEAMDNDLNVPEATKWVFEFANKANKLIDENALGAEGAAEAIAFLKKVNEVLAVLDFSEKEIELTEVQKALIKERELARKNKDWKTSDIIRDKLAAQGIMVEDKKEGTRWKTAK